MSTMFFIFFLQKIIYVYLTRQGLGGCGHDVALRWPPVLYAYIQTFAGLDVSRHARTVKPHFATKYIYLI